jgi:hypothetical protein
MVILRVGRVARCSIHAIKQCLCQHLENNHKPLININFKNKKGSMKEPFKNRGGVFLPPATGTYLPQAAIINAG